MRLRERRPRRDDALQVCAKKLDRNAVWLWLSAGRFRFSNATKESLCKVLRISSPRPRAHALMAARTQQASAPPSTLATRGMVVHKFCTVVIQKALRGHLATHGERISKADFVDLVSRACEVKAAGMGVEMDALRAGLEYAFDTKLAPLGGHPYASSSGSSRAKGQLTQASMQEQVASVKEAPPPERAAGAAADADGAGDDEATAEQIPAAAYHTTRNPTHPPEPTVGVRTAISLFTLGHGAAAGVPRPLGAPSLPATAPMLKMASAYSRTGLSPRQLPPPSLPLAASSAGGPAGPTVDPASPDLSSSRSGLGAARRLKRATSATVCRHHHHHSGNSSSSTGALASRPSTQESRHPHLQHRHRFDSAYLGQLSDSSSIGEEAHAERAASTMTADSQQQPAAGAAAAAGGGAERHETTRGGSAAEDAALMPVAEASSADSTSGKGAHSSQGSSRASALRYAQNYPNPVSSTGGVHRRRAASATSLRPPPGSTSTAAGVGGASNGAAPATDRAGGTSVRVRCSSSSGSRGGASLPSLASQSVGQRPGSCHQKKGAVPTSTSPDPSVARQVSTFSSAGACATIVSERSMRPVRPVRPSSSSCSPSASASHHHHHMIPTGAAPPPCNSTGRPATAGPLFAGGGAGARQRPAASPAPVIIDPIVRKLGPEAAELLAQSLDWRGVPGASDVTAKSRSRSPPGVTAGARRPASSPAGLGTPSFPSSSPPRSAALVNAGRNRRRMRLHALAAKRKQAEEAAREEAARTAASLKIAGGVGGGGEGGEAATAAGVGEGTEEEGGGEGDGDGLRPTITSTSSALTLLRVALARQSTRVISLLRYLATDLEGSCSKKEFRLGLSAAGCPSRPSEIDQLFDSWDGDADGYITLVDLLRIMHHGGKPKPKPSSRRTLFVPITQEEIKAPPDKAHSAMMALREGDNTKSLESFAAAVQAARSSFLHAAYHGEVAAAQHGSGSTSSTNSRTNSRPGSRQTSRPSSPNHHPGSRPGSRPGSAAASHSPSHSPSHTGSHTGSRPGSAAAKIGSSSGLVGAASASPPNAGGNATARKLLRSSSSGKWGGTLLNRATSHRTMQSFMEAEAEKARKEAERAGASDGFMALRSRSARAANSMVLLLQERARSANGEVGPEEFAEGLTELGVCKPGEDIRQLFETLDTDGSGTLAIGELKAAIALILDPAADKTLGKVTEKGTEMSAPIKKLRNKLAKEANRIIEMFLRWDKDGNGTITMDEFVEGLLPDIGFSDFVRQDGTPAVATRIRDPARRLSLPCRVSPLPCRLRLACFLCPLLSCLPVRAFPIDTTASLHSCAVEELFSAFDTDGSGQLSFAEVNRMVRAGSVTAMAAAKKNEARQKRRSEDEVVIPYTNDDLDKLRKDTRSEVVRYVVRAEMQNAMDLELYGDLFDEKKSGSDQRAGGGGGGGASAERDTAEAHKAGVTSPMEKVGGGGGAPSTLKRAGTTVSAAVAPLATLRRLMVADARKGANKA